MFGGATKGSEAEGNDFTYTNETFVYNPKEKTWTSIPSK